jgi:fermentation-respiration switch protein FrsA (DUF1100 family)
MLVALTLAGCGAAPTAPAQLGARTAAAALPAPAAAAATTPGAAAKPATIVAGGREVVMGPSAAAAPAISHDAPPAGLFERDYDPTVRYTATAEEAEDVKELTSEVEAQNDNAHVGPVFSSPWGLIGAALVGGSLVGYGIYTGMIGSKDLMYPSKLEGLVKKPSAYGWTYEQVNFWGHDGIKLRGWYIPAATHSNKAVMLFHGHTSNKDRYVEKYAGWLHQDFNLFIYDSRFHGESEGKFTTLGYNERKDATLALDQVKNRCNGNIGVMGESMGAAVAIGVAADHPEIKSVWADCSFDSLHDAVAPRAKNRKYPLPEYVAFSVVKTASIRAKANLAKYDPIRSIKSIAPRPVYLVHGQDDDSTTIINSEKLFAEAAQPKTFWRVPGAKHAESWKIQPAEYQSRVHTFFTESL